MTLVTLAFIIGLLPLAGMVYDHVKGNLATHTDEWRQKRLEHFLLHVELSPTCATFGHSVPEDATYCEYCEDVAPVRAHSSWSSDYYFPEDHNGLIKTSDPRILAKHDHGPRWKHLSDGDRRLVLIMDLSEAGYAAAKEREGKYSDPWRPAGNDLNLSD
jgi:hypothetical protein